MQRWLAFRQPCSRAGPATLRKETDPSEARNRRAAGSHPVCTGRRGDAGRGGLHAAQARSRRAGHLRASSLRSRPHHPAKEWAAYFPRERADADDHVHAKRLPPKLNVPQLQLERVRRGVFQRQEVFPRVRDMGLEWGRPCRKIGRGSRKPVRSGMPASGIASWSLPALSSSCCFSRETRSSVIVGQASWSNKKTLTYPPVLAKIEGSVLHTFPQCQHDQPANL